MVVKKESVEYHMTRWIKQKNSYWLSLYYGPSINLSVLSYIVACPFTTLKRWYYLNLLFRCAALTSLISDDIFFTQPGILCPGRRGGRWSEGNMRANTTSIAKWSSAFSFVCEGMVAVYNQDHYGWVCGLAYNNMSDVCICFDSGKNKLTDAKIVRLNQKYAA